MEEEDRTPKRRTVRRVNEAKGSKIGMTKGEEQ